MNNYRMNKERAKFRNTEPTLTDQSQAADTDVNVIMAKYALTGSAPGAAGEPMYGDFSQLPRDFRSMIEQARSIEAIRGKLPAELAELSIGDLVELDQERLVNLLTPKHVAPQPEKKTEVPPKKDDKDTK